MSLGDRDSGDEPERYPRRRLQCRDGMCGATDCAKCGHGDEEEDPRRAITRRLPVAVIAHRHTAADLIGTLPRLVRRIL